jgi:Leucine-rich repeat (LRR) protein
MSNQHKLFEQLIAEGKYNEVLKIINKNDEVVQMTPDEDIDDDLLEFKNIYNQDVSYSNLSQVNPDIKFNESALNLTLIEQPAEDKSIIEKEEMFILPEVSKIDTDIVKELQILLEKGDQNFNRFLNIEELADMQAEEIYGQMYQLEARRKLFKYKDHMLQDISATFKSECFRQNTTSIVELKSISYNDMPKESFEDNFKNENFIDVIIQKVVKVKEIQKETKITKHNIRTLFEKKNYLTMSNKASKYIPEITLKDEKPMNIITGNIELPLITNSEDILTNPYKQQNMLWNKAANEINDIKHTVINYNHFNSHFISQYETKKQNIELSTEHILHILTHSDINEVHDISELEIKCENLNNISNLNPFPKLRRMDLASNCFTSLDFLITYKHTTNLIDLNLCQNKLTNINIQVFKNIPNLLFLNLEINQISQIENLQNCKSLISLNLSYNKIDKINNLEALSNLEKLYLNGNNIRNVENLNRNRKLKVLSIGKNKIKELGDIYLQVPYIEELTLFDNKIKSLDNFSFSYLKYLYINSNKIREVKFGFCPSLEEIYLQNNKIFGFSGSLANCSRLKKLDISFNNIQNISDVIMFLENNRNLEAITFNNNPFHLAMNKVISLEILMANLHPTLKKVDFQSVKTKQIAPVDYNSSCSNFFNIFTQHHQIVSYFNSKYNIVNYSNTEKFQLMNILNHNYFVSKLLGLDTINKINGNSVIKINSFSEQFRYKKHTYYFKNKLEYIKHSLVKYIKLFKHKRRGIEILQKNIKGYVYRKRFCGLNVAYKYLKFIRKLSRLQAYIRSYLYRSKLKERLKKIILLNEEEDQVDLEFFNNDNNILIAKEHIEEKYFKLELIPSIQAVPDVTIVNQAEKDILDESKISSIKPEAYEKDDIKLQNSTDIKQLIDLRDKERHIHKAKKQNYDSFNIININGTNLISVVLPHIKTPVMKNQNKDNKMTIKSDTVLPPVNISTHIEKSKREVNISTDNNNENSIVSNSFKGIIGYMKSEIKYLNGRPLLPKRAEYIKLLEEEAKIAILQAKEENKFVNKELEDLVIKKIRKKYHKLIQKIIMN